MFTVSCFSQEALSVKDSARLERTLHNCFLFLASDQSLSHKLPPHGIVHRKGHSTQELPVRLFLAVVGKLFALPLKPASQSLLRILQVEFLIGRASERIFSEVRLLVSVLAFKFKCSVIRRMIKFWGLPIPQSMPAFSSAILLFSSSSFSSASFRASILTFSSSRSRFCCRSSVTVNCDSGSASSSGPYKPQIIVKLQLKRVKSR
jgi:hypothetical protein